jgi:hypothetical protein
MDTVLPSSHNARQDRVGSGVAAGIAAALTFIASCFLLVSVGFAIESDELRSNPHYSQQYFQATKAAADIALGAFIIFVLLSTALLARAVGPRWKIHGVVRWLGAFVAVLLSSCAMSYIWLAGIAPDPVHWVSALLRQEIGRLTR